MSKIGRQSLFANIDWIIVLIYLFLVLFGWLNIHAATFNETSKGLFDFERSSGKQFVWICIAIILALFIIVVDAKFYTTFAYLFYGITILLLIFVIFGGSEVSGAKSWIGYGDLGIQPSEFAKIATALALAKYLGESNRNIENIKTQIVSFAFFVIPMIIILLQNDTGSAIVFLIFMFVLYREGMPGTLIWAGLIFILIFVLTLLFSYIHIFIGVAILTLFFWYFIRKFRKDVIRLILIALAISVFSFTVDIIFEKVLQPHQKNRIEVLLGIKTDLKGAGYNVNQSKIAIGSGGFFGKGYLNGTQTKFRFVPEQSTDFIYCTVGEEWGFLGSVTVIILYLILLIRIVLQSERQRSHFSRIYGYGVAGILFTHFAINIGMTLGLVPVIGIPLPYISYGGSSLLAFTILLFIFIKLDMNRQNVV